jgi:hypothetical protein
VLAVAAAVSQSMLDVYIYRYEKKIVFASYPPARGASD